MKELLTMWKNEKCFKESYDVQKAFFLMSKHCQKCKPIENLDYIDFVIEIASKTVDTNELITIFLFKVLENSNLSIKDLKEMDFPEETIEAVTVLFNIRKESFWNQIELVRRNHLAKQAKMYEISVRRHLLTPKEQELDNGKLEKAFFYLSNLIDDYN